MFKPYYALELVKMQGRTKPKQRVFKKTVNEYAAASSAHGVAYIFEPDRLIIERVFWILVVAFAFGYRLEFMIYKLNRG